MRNAALVALTTSALALATLAGASTNASASDTKMARAYQRLLSQTKPEARARLRASQSTWTKFRDAECQYEIAATGATAFNKEWSYECLKGLTEDRAWRLDQQLHCPGVDGVPCKTRG